MDSVLWIVIALAVGLLWTVWSANKGRKIARRGRRFARRLCVALLVVFAAVLALSYA